MNVSDAFQRYAQRVCEQIRWKKAHPAVAQEIENHLIDQKNAYLAAGDTESIAEEKALLQMGDPVAVGAALDQTHKPAPQWGMLALVLLLFLLGGILQFLLLRGMEDTTFSAHAVQMLLLFLPISLAAFIGMYFLDFSFFGKHPYILPLSLLIIDLAAQLVGAAYGGQRWLTLGHVSISPLALSLLFPLAFCGLFYQQRNRGSLGYLISGFLAAGFCLLLAICHTAGGILVFLFSAGTLMAVAAKKEWFGKRSKAFLLLLVLAALLFFVLLWLYAPFRYRYGWERLQTVFFPYTADAEGNGYLSAQLRQILSHAAFLGKGTAFSGANTYLLTDTSLLRSDYLLTFLTYHYGWAVSGGLVLLLAVFLGLGFRKSLKQKSIFGQMISLSILCTFTAEILIYILANLGIWLIAPLALPFLSYGATALLVNMALAGVLLSVFRTGEVYRDTQNPLFAESKFIQWNDGKLVISFK